MQLSLIMFVVSIDWLATCIPVPPVVPERKCAFLASPRNAETAQKAGNVSGGVQHCAWTNCCMGFFELENGQARPDLLGCSAVGTSCPESSCHVSKPFQNYSSCFCSSDYCNLNITLSDQADQHQPSRTSGSTGHIPRGGLAYITTGEIPGGATAVVLGRTTSQKTQKVLNHLSTITYFIIFFGALITMVCLIFCVKFLKDCTREPHTCDIQKEADINLVNIKLQKVVARGHFACVWQGFFQGSLVALKVFTATLRQEFIKERDVYLLPSMNHPGIAQFLGAGRIEKEFVLVLELATQGSLSKFLSINVCDWASSLKLAQTLSQGLAYLHSDLNTIGVSKQVIAHCDLSSSNVLVKADGSCALCDFGCSTVLRRSRNHQTLQDHSDRTEDRIQMGTLHYMSPEILEGCVNLSSGRCLLQADVYSLGLLFWELFMRCSDLHKDSTIPVHMMPYEAELGPSPPFEGLLSLVSEQRVRPAIPVSWNPHQQGFSLQELIEDCWDHDPDARLTAQCAADRLASLPLDLVL